ncbi:MAG: nucleotide kinase domain-containing protein [Solirubrobacteraceae bacterium]
MRAWPMIGPFMGYQLAIDLNYSEQLNFDEDDFTVPGPGAVRGLDKVFSDFAGHTPGQLIARMVDRQEEEFARLGLSWSGLFGHRRLHAIDCQGLFCETDKYARAKFPDLKSNRVRIKQEFREPKPAIDLFYPPKWGVNGHIARARSDASPAQPTLDQHPPKSEKRRAAPQRRPAVTGGLFEPAVGC